MATRRSSGEVCVGLISDTHGLLRPEAVQALQASQLIIHAGDIGSAEVLDQLRAIAPVTAVRGNNDIDPWARQLPQRVTLQVGGVLLYVVHELADLRTHPVPSRAAAVITGHSHQPRVEFHQSVLFVNPGSAGPRRFRLPVTVAFLTIRAGELKAQIHELQTAAAVRRRQSR